MKARLRDALWAASDRLCRHGGWRFELGNLLGELGWLLR